MFYRNNFYTFLWLLLGFSITVLLLIYAIIPFFSKPNNVASSKNTNFAKIMKDRNSKQIPSKLKWAKDFNHDYKITEKEKPKSKMPSSFSHFKNKQ